MEDIIITLLVIIIKVNVLFFGVVFWLIKTQTKELRNLGRSVHGLQEIGKTRSGEINKLSEKLDQQATQLKHIDTILEAHGARIGTLEQARAGW